MATKYLAVMKDVKILKLKLVYTAFYFDSRKYNNNWCIKDVVYPAYITLTTK